MARGASATLLLAALSAQAGPVGPSVAAGGAAFSSQGNTLSITNAPGTIINWQGFSIGSGEAARFIQSGATSAVLNRVTGNATSQILGQLLSNGRVFLVNPNGIVFGQGAVIDTAGFVASTLNITDRDFLSGRLHFDGGSGVLRNEGVIRASGDIFLVGPSIENTGLIHSDAGSVLLAAGRSVTITSPDAQGVQFALQAPTDTALNLGTIEARNAAGLFAGTLRHSGDIRVAGASEDATGRVILSAQKEVIIDGNATISADSSVGRGGSIQVLGEHVGILDQASLSARGATGGGEILIGGDLQGKNPDVRNAAITYVSAGTTLDASAAGAGDGGKVIVWADDTTRAYGNLAARGGAQGGNGGLIEASGRQYLEFSGSADTSAPRGSTGTLLLDPSNVNITNGADSFAGGSFSGGNFNSGATAGTATIGWTTIDAQLATNNVVITTSGNGGAGNLSILNGVTYNRANNLSFLAHNGLGVAIGSAITNSGAGGLTMLAGWDGNLGSPGVVNGTGNLGGFAFAVDYVGPVTLKAGNAIGLGAGNGGGTLLRSSSSNLTLHAFSDIDLNNNCCGPSVDSLRAGGILSITSVTGQVMNTGRQINLFGDGGISINAGTNIGNVTTGRVLGALTATGAGGSVSLTAGTTGTGGIRIDSIGVVADGAVTMTAPGNIELSNGFAIIANGGAATLSSAGGAIFQSVACCGSITARGDVALSAANGISIANLTAGNGVGGDGRLLASNTGSGADLGLGGVLRATKAGLAPNQYAIDLGSARDVYISSSNSNGDVNMFGALSTGGIRINAQGNVDLNTNCCGPGTSTYTAPGNFDITATTGQIINGRAVHLSGGNLTLTAGTNIGPVAAGAALGALTSTAVGGDVTLAAGTTGVGGIRLSGFPVTANDAISFSAPDRINLGNSGLTATGGALTLTSTGADVVQTACCTTLTAGGDITVNAVTGIGISNLIAGTSGSGRLTLTTTGATGDIGIGAAVRATNSGLAANDYAIDISAGRDFGYTGSNSFSTTQFSTATSGGIRVQAARNIELNNNCCGAGPDTISAAGDLVLTAGSGGTGNIFNSSSAKQGLAGDSVYLSAETSLTTGGAITAPNTLSLTLTNSDLSVVSLAATNVILNALNGAILDANGGGVNVTATSLSATAKTGISLDTSVASLGATNTGSGAVSIREADGATVSALGTGGGAISLSTASGTLTSTGTINIPGGATINGAFDNQGTLNVAGGTANFGSAAFAMNGGSINVAGGATFSKNGGTLTWNGGTLSMAAPGSLLLDNTTLALNSNITNSGTIQLQNASTLSGTGTLTNTGDLNLYSIFLSGTPTVVSANLVNQGNIQTRDTIQINGAFSNAAGATMLNNDAAVTVANGFTNAGTIQLYSDGFELPPSFSVTAGTLVNTGTIVTSGTITQDQPLAAQLDNRGTLTAAVGRLVLNKPGAAHTNSGSINASGANVLVQLSGGGTFTQSGGSINAGAGRSFTLTGGPLAWQGGELAGSGAYSLGGGVTFSGSGARVLNGPSLNLGVTTLPSGSLTVQSGSLGFSSIATISPGALLDIAGGSVTGASSIDVQGEVRMSGGTLAAASIGLVPGGVLKGNGTVNASVVNGGTVAPGASPGTLVINGNYSQGPGGTLAVELGGTSQGVDYDWLQVTGTASFNGTLGVSLFGGFSPSTGTVFDVVSYASRSGDFSSVSLPGGLAMSAAPGPTAYRMVTTAASPVVLASFGSVDAGLLARPASEARIGNDKFLGTVLGGWELDEDGTKVAGLVCK